MDKKTKLIEYVIKNSYITNPTFINLLDSALEEELAIQRVSQRSELLRVFNSFYDWHKKQGYVSVKRDDFEEYLKTLNCG